MQSFGPEVTAVVVGASGGIGHALVRCLAGDPSVERVLALSRSGAILEHPKVERRLFRLDDEDSIAQAAESVAAYHLIIVATGLLHDGAALQPEKTWRALDALSLEQAFSVNTIGPALVAKHFLPRLARGRKSVFAALSARVGSISDNRLGGWHAYRAAKAALNMLIRNFAIELSRRNRDAVCVGLHPGTVDTSLSEPFQTAVPRGKLFTPDRAAGQLLDVIDGLGPEDSGNVFAWDGTQIPS